MFNQASMRPQGEARRETYRPVRPLSPPAPDRNWLLAALPPQDYWALLPHLQPVPLHRDAALHESGDRERYLYFITAGVVCRSFLTEDGAPTAFAMTGSEGVIGMAAILGGQTTPGRASVLSAGHAYRLRADVPALLFGPAGALPRLMLRYIHVLVIQCVQAAACNRHHAIRQQLSRLLLACADRLDERELDLTHEMIAHVLGVRREGITQTLGEFDRRGWITLKRARIFLRDRRQLEAQACECYSVIRRELRRLLTQPASPQRSAATQNFV